MEPDITTSEPAVDSFDALLELENRIQGIADRVGEARRLQQAAEQNAARLERLVSEQEHRIEDLRVEIEQLRSERRQVRERIEFLLSRIDSL
jgi:FtsZ-binding cell division protein ZapB